MLSLLGPGVQSLIRELRSCKLSCTAKKKKKDKLIEKERTIELLGAGVGGCGVQRNYCLMSTEFLSEMMKSSRHGWLYNTVNILNTSELYG